MKNTMKNEGTYRFVTEVCARFKILANQELRRHPGKFSELLTINGDMCHSELIDPTRADLIELYQLQPNHQFFLNPTAYTISAVYLALLLAKGEQIPARFNKSAAVKQLNVN